jgi:quercetin dioxygenase-like cupin family protein
MDTQTPAVRVVQPNEGRMLWVLGNHQTHKLTGDDTDGNVFIWEERVPPQGGPPPHRHLAEDEVFYVLAGELSFFSDEGATKVGSGTLVHLPKGSVHTFKNTGATEAVALVLTAPAGFERYFAAIGTPAAAGEAAPPVTPEAVEHALAAAPLHNIAFELPR